MICRLEGRLHSALFRIYEFARRGYQTDPEITAQRSCLLELGNKKQRGINGIVAIAMIQ
jgi:hypothetical protein